MERTGGIGFHSTWESDLHMKMFLVSDIVTKILQVVELSDEKPEIIIAPLVDQDGLKTLRNIRIAAGAGGY
jgi:hypothetical protein